MEKKAAIDLIEKTFNNGFDLEQYTLFLRNLLNDYDGEKENDWSQGNYIYESFREHISRFKRMGVYTDPEGAEMELLVIETKGVSKLERARTSLRNFVIRRLQDKNRDYALAAFYGKEDNGADWRFSFIKIEHESYKDTKGKVKTRKELTPAKRYSFLVGEHEQAYTAQKQLLPVLQNDYSIPAMEDLEACFSIEKVTDEFFEQYKDLYIKLSEHFESDKAVQKILKPTDIDTARFTKKLLGQIVFLYFLQKKGWLGVPKTEDWGNGEKRFVQKLFSDADSKKKNFFNDYLKYLFYEALAKPRSGAEPSYYKLFDCKIPFLNGGLFEADYDWKAANFTIPNTLFRNEEKNKAGDTGTGVLDVFDRYNFTIKEDEPLEKEVAVDPEMLGKVFENMLEITERKSKGAFYTPREIVHYMCQESLIHYLNSAVNENVVGSYQPIDSDQLAIFGGAADKKGQRKIEMEHKGKALVPKEDIEEFVRKGFLAIENDQVIIEKGKETSTYKFQLPESVRTHADLLDEKLTNIKICDPAIGSGAFPVGLLHELVTAQKILLSYLSEQYLDKKLKKIGLDKKEFKKEPIKYIYRVKRHAIQESIYGVDIDASAIDIARLRLWLSLIVDEEDFESIEALPNLDYKIVKGNTLIGFLFDSVGRSEVLNKVEELKLKILNETDHDEKEKIRHKVRSLLAPIYENSAKGIGYKVDFEYRYEFSEVFTKNKNGFDLVIGNPPYVQIQKLEDSLKKTLAKLQYKTFSSSGDIYELFYEKGNNLLCKGGHLCYITSNKWLRANYGESTRSYFLNYTNPKLLFDFGQQLIFASAIVHSNVLLFQRAANQNEFIGCQMSAGKFIGSDLSQYFHDNYINLDYFTEEVWAISTPEMIEIKANLEQVGMKLKNWDINIYRGILTGYNDAFIIDKKTKQALIKDEPKLKEIIKPILRGRDTRKYYCNFHDIYLINTHNGDRKRKIKKIDVPLNFPKLFEYLKSFPSDIQKRSDKGDHWTNLRNCAFLAEVEKQKIIFSEIVSEPQFFFDKSNYYPEATSFLITGENLKWLIAFLNSFPITVIFRIFYAGGELVGKYRYKKSFLETLPIPEPDEEYKDSVEIIVDYLTFYKSLDFEKSDNKLIANYFEILIDAIVYETLFSKEFEKADKEIIKHIGRLKPIDDNMSNEKKLSIIQSEFNRLYDPNHIVRNNIESLDSVEEVRVIKEAL